MESRNLICLLLLFSLTSIVFSQTKVKLTDYNEQTLSLHWSDLSTKLQSAHELVIPYTGLTETTLQKVLRQPMKNLKILTFSDSHADPTTPTIHGITQSNQFLTHLLIKTIFTSEYFNELTALNLIGTNIDCRFLEILDTIDWSKKQLKLEKILLGANFIGKKGLISLSKLPLPPLKELDLSGHLLIEPESIDALINLINNDNQPSRLQTLDISTTSIRREDFIRIIEVIDTNNLLHLNFSNINLHNANKYKDGFNLTAYQYLARRNFSKLVSLTMNDIDLDLNVIKLFSNWTFPSLESLSLYNNFIDDQCVKIWITRKHFPKLKKLLLFNTDITDESMRLLASENFEFEELNVGYTKITHEGLKQIAKFKPLMKKLFLKSMKLQNSHLADLLHTINLTSFTQISFTDNKEISDIFKYFPWERLPHLQKLILTGCDIEQSISYMLDQPGPLSTTLKFLMINGTYKTQEITEQFLVKASSLFPQLEYVNLLEFYYMPINFTNLKLDQLKENLLVEMGYIQFQKKNGKINIKQLKSLGWLAMYTSSHDLTAYFEPPQSNIIKLTKDIDPNNFLPDHLSLQVAKQIHKICNINHLATISINNYNEYLIFKHLLPLYESNRFPDLQGFNFDAHINTTELLNLMNQIPMPKVKNLYLTIKIDKYHQEFTEIKYKLRQYKLIDDLQLKFLYNFTELNHTNNQHKFLNDLHFPFLFKLDLSQNYLNSQEIAGIIYNHSHTLRYLILHSNFLEDQFMRILYENQVTLNLLDTRLITFSKQEFRELAHVELGFIKQILLDKCELTHEHIIAFVEDRRNISSYVFPKLNFLSLNENDIEEQGIRILFESGLPELISIRIKRNFNPNFINILLTYSTKIMELVSVGVQIYAMNSTINPLSTRRIPLLAIDMLSFSDRDFEILYSLNFNRLTFQQIQINNFYSCNCFHHVLKAMSHVNYLYLALINIDSGLNSSCISLQDDSYKFFTSQIEEIVIFDLHMTTNIAEFAFLLFRTQRSIRRIILSKTRLPPSLFTLLKSQQLSSLVELIINSNYIDDAGMSIILGSKLDRLKYMDISFTDVTVKSLKLMKNKNMRSLVKLVLSGITLGEEGLEILRDIRADKMQTLWLRQTQLTNLSKLNEAHFPNVYLIDVSRNKLKFEHLVEFWNNFNRSHFPRLSEFDARGIPLSESQNATIAQFQLKFNMAIYVDDPYRLKFTNAAGY